MNPLPHSATLDPASAARGMDTFCACLHLCGRLLKAHPRILARHQEISRGKPGRTGMDKLWPPVTSLFSTIRPPTDRAPRRDSIKRCRKGCRPKTFARSTNRTRVLQIESPRHSGVRSTANWKSGKERNIRVACPCFDEKLRRKLGLRRKLIQVRCIER